MIHTVSPSMDCGSVVAYGAHSKLLPSGGSGLARDLAALRAQRSNGLQQLSLPLSGHALASDPRTHEESSPYANAASSPFLTLKQHAYDDRPHRAYSRSNFSVASPVLTASPRQHHRTVSNGDAASGGPSTLATTGHVTPLPGVVPGSPLQIRNAVHTASRGTAAGEGAASPRYHTLRARADVGAQVTEPAPVAGPPSPGSCGKLPSIGLSSPTSTSGPVHDSTAFPYCPSPVPKSRLGSMAGSDSVPLQGGSFAAPTATPRPANGPTGRQPDCPARVQPSGAAQGVDGGCGGSTCSGNSRNGGGGEGSHPSGGVGTPLSGAVVVDAYVHRHHLQQQRAQRPAAAAITLTARLQLPLRAASTGKAAPNAITLPSLPLSAVGAPQPGTPKVATGGTRPHAAAPQPTRRVVSSPFTAAAADASAMTGSAYTSAPAAMPCTAAARAHSTPAPAAVLPVPPVSSSPRGGAVVGQDGVVAQLLAVSAGLPAAMQRERWRLDDYEVHERIYKGSMSAVYTATCLPSGLPVALKVYFLSRVPNNVLHTLVREVQIHSQLHHPNVLTLYGAFQDGKHLVLVEELAPMGDLHTLHRSLDSRMTEADVIQLVLVPFLDALTYIHSRGICHRDVKPENIFFTASWRLVLGDFGVAINVSKERPVTRTGTVEYMAPEVERCPLKMLPEENKDRDDLAYGYEVDVWAVGVLAYELLVGFPPFAVSAAAGSALPLDGGPAPSAATAPRAVSFPASVSAEARDFILSALCARPEERPSAAQLARHPWVRTAAGAAGAKQVTRPAPATVAAPPAGSPVAC